MMGLGARSKKSKEKNGMNTFLVVLCWIGGFIVIAGIALLILNRGAGTIRKLVVESVDLAKIEDGTYLGTYHKGRWTYDVKVTVKNHAITSVKNTNKRMDGFKRFNDKAEAEIILRQTPQIDIVSGATINSKALAKAVENALNSAPK
jgi:uncharacterized protein with FMN-binding domain